jgi:hypothetical protein
MITALLVASLPTAYTQDKVVATDSSNAAMNSCLANNATQSPTLTSNLNKPISGGEFTFYGNPRGPGACGTDTGKVMDLTDLELNITEITRF